ncbi:MAG TPA: hypothetical protein VFP61_01285 [Acidimicrobiales bacterium]|nr:hypothetical protein [Acidimicrobiales bacterium]
MNWQQDADRVWTYRGPGGDLLAAVTQLGPYIGYPEPVFQTSGRFIDQVMRYGTLAEAQSAVEDLVRRNS